MPDKRFMPRRLHYSIPLVWGLTAPQVTVMVVTFAVFAFFVISAGSVSSFVTSILLMGLFCGGEYLLFQVMQGMERSLMKHLISRIKYGAKVPVRYAGR